MQGAMRCRTALHFHMRHAMRALAARAGETAERAGQTTSLDTMQNRTYVGHRDAMRSDSARARTMRCDAMGRLGLGCAMEDPVVATGPAVVPSARITSMRYDSVRVSGDEMRYDVLGAAKDVLRRGVFHRNQWLDTAQCDGIGQDLPSMRVAT
jgi:hypothetical protein